MPHSPEAPVEAASSQKRKRDGDDAGGGQADRIPQPPPPQSGNGTPIHYCTQRGAPRLELVRVHEAFFSEVLALMKEYEGVLSRHESLAARLGARLLGPRLARALDNMFDGPIIVAPDDPYAAPSPVGWSEVVRHLRASPGDCAMATLPEHGRVCRFALQGRQVAIGESDYRLIASGAVDRFRLAPDEPLEEDERAEAATLDILEPRVQGLIVNADEVARKARQLNYHLSGRKAAISLRRAAAAAAAAQKQAAPGLQAASAAARAPGPADPYDLHADLLRQFQAPAGQPGPARPPGGASLSLPGTPVVPPSAVPRPPSRTPSRTPSQPADPGGRPSPAPGGAPGGDDGDPLAGYRPFIAARIERLPRGGAIVPPCDRCRRLGVQCVKHLTACQGCTRKHAKCSWRAITGRDAAWLRGEPEVPEAAGGGGSGAETDGPPEGVPP